MHVRLTNWAGVAAQSHRGRPSSSYTSKLLSDDKSGKVRDRRPSCVISSVSLTLVNFLM